MTKYEMNCRSTLEFGAKKSHLDLKFMNINFKSSNISNMWDKLKYLLINAVT